MDAGNPSYASAVKFVTSLLLKQDLMQIPW